MLVFALMNHLWWTPSNSLTLSQRLVQMKSSAISVQNASLSRIERSCSTRQSLSCACAATTRGAWYSGRASERLSILGAGFVAVLMDVLLACSVRGFMALRGD